MTRNLSPVNIFLVEGPEGGLAQTEVFLTVDAGEAVLDDASQTLGMVVDGGELAIDDALGSNVSRLMALGGEVTFYEEVP